MKVKKVHLFPALRTSALGTKLCQKLKLYDSVICIEIKRLKPDEAPLMTRLKLGPAEVTVHYRCINFFN